MTAKANKTYQSQDDYLTKGGKITICPGPGKDETNPAAPKGEQIPGQPIGNLRVPIRNGHS